MRLKDPLSIQKDNAIQDRIYIEQIIPISKLKIEIPILKY
jgi:hypothetical protein